MAKWRCRLLLSVMVLCLCTVELIAQSDTGSSGNETNAAPDSATSTPGVGQNADTTGQGEGTAGQESTTVGQGEGTAGQEGTTASQEDTTAGQDTTTGQGENTGGQGGGTTGQGGNTGGPGGDTAAQSETTAEQEDTTPQVTTQPETTDGNDCASDPCQNGGNCTDGTGSYTCACPERYTGNNCETRISVCDSSPCNNGICSDQGDSFKCICNTGWNQPDCSQDIDECTTGVAQCREDSRCENNDGGYDCPCLPDFEDVDGKCKAVVIWPDFASSELSLQGQNANLHVLDIPIPFDFYGRIYRKIYVYGNGYISLGQGRALTQAPLPSEWPYSPGLIGVYWSDMEFPVDSQSMVMIHEDTSHLNNVTENSPLITYVSNVVKHDKFKPLYIAVITWVKARPHPAADHPDDEATFQLILATDGKFSYAIRGYTQVWMNTDEAERPHVTIAYSGKIGFGGSSEVESREGPVSWPLFEQESDLSDASFSCAQSLQTAMSSQGSKLQALPPCPCYKTQADHDPWFKVRGATPACYDSQFPFEEVTQSCCYDSMGLLIKNSKERLPLVAGDASLTAAEMFCCGVNHKQLCGWFYEQLDLSDCSDYKPLTVASGFGDPHILTFDRFSYTFAGLGEYVIFRAGEWELQGRTELHEATNTTFFSAYALRPAANSSSYQFYIEADALIGDWTGTSHSNYKIMKSSTEISFYVSHDLVVKIIFESGVLKHQIMLRRDSETMVEGLMGNFDDDASNDVEQAINDFVKSWKVTNTTTLFDYKKPSPTSFEDQNIHPGFTPRFIPSVESELLAAMDDDMQRAVAQDLCGSNILCLQDFFINKENSSAIEVRTAVEEIETLQKDLTSQPLIFTNMNDPVTINPSSVFELTLAVNDATVTDFVVDGSLDSLSGLTLDKAAFSWNLTASLPTLRLKDYPQSLKFTVTNADGVTAVYAPMMRLCLCQSVDQCSAELAPVSGVNGEMDGNVISLACDCGERREGRYCEAEADVCINCYSPSTCNETLQNYCAACPVGYQGDGKTCRDINECLVNNGGCEQICVNTPGNYSCDCQDGYEQDGHNCIEIDECRQNASICSNANKYCFNVAGSYKCLCYPGLLGEDCVKAPFTYLGNVTLSPTSDQAYDFIAFTDSTSEKYQDLAEKVETAIENALSATLGSGHTIYVEVLRFMSGTPMSGTGSRAKRADDPLPTVAIFRINLADQQSADDINRALQNAEDPNCDSNCNYNGIVIVSGPPQIDDNADLCSDTDIHQCNMDTSTCLSESGRTFCPCIDGFVPNENDPFSCIDLNECENNENNEYCAAGTLCVNLMGSYQCECQDGFVWDVASLQCIADSCHPNPCKHDGVCIVADTSTGFHCSCEYEWDGPICDDEHVEARKMKIALICVAVILGFICLCLIIIITVMCVKHRRTLESHSYSNSRYNDSTVVLPRPKVNNRNSTEMAENGSNVYAMPDNRSTKSNASLQDLHHALLVPMIGMVEKSGDNRTGEGENYTSFGRHAPTPGQKEGEKKNYYYNRAYTMEEEGQRL